MRTPNSKCIVCGKDLYRRPHELKTVSLICCIGCRSVAYRKYPNKNAIKNLELGREKGTNHLGGIPKSKISNRKRSESHKKWCKENPDKLKLRGSKIRGENHYKWKGGVTQINKSIRSMSENRKWMDAVKSRDGKCLFCGSTEELESDHIIPLIHIIEEYSISNRQDARNCELLWDINNGRTLCKKCHCKKDNRKYSKNGNGRRKTIQQNAS